MALYVGFIIAFVILCGFLGRVFGKDRSGPGWALKWTTRDLLIVAILAAITGVINTGLGNVWYLLTASLGPLGGALIVGAFETVYILAAFLIRRPGAALLLGLIETSVEVLLGNAMGISVLIPGLTQGLGAEIVLAFSGYRKYDLGIALWAGAASTLLGLSAIPFIFGWDPAALLDVWYAVPVNIISGLILAGYLGYLLAKAISKTGLVRSATTT